MNELLYLISQTYVVDENSNNVAVPVEHAVYGIGMSVSQSEFFAAAQNNIRSERKIKIWKLDYNGERKARVGDVTYDIYRTYAVDDYIELYLSTKAGDDNGNQRS